MARRRAKHLYSEASRADFERRYGKEHGDLVYQETLGKVAREQAAKSSSGVKIEHVRGHIAISDRGNRYRVRGHSAYIHAKPHGYGHHAGKCDGACRSGARPHRHPRGRGSSQRG